MTAKPSKPIQVVCLLEELGLNYKINSFRFDEVKKPPFININPNGRTPAIEDPNTGLTLWETGAIHHCVPSQWLHFQVIGQGPYFGQLGWFAHLHPEKVPAAIERYTNELHRVLGVLEIALSNRPDDAQWLVGDKMTFADMAFMPWIFRLSEVLSLPWDEVWKDTPRVRAWHKRMVELPSWKRSMDIRARLMDEQGLQWNGVPKGIDTFDQYQKKIAEGEDTETE
ncbi:glutathione S-transferase [Astrocystis sublimbata]|nr:glutathione S-transferase [Astrocystis sublimbata]